jgi:hypothetical protein
MSHAYRLSELKIESAIELPELAPWDGADDARTDVFFQIGNVPPRLTDPDHVAPAFQTKGCCEYLVALPGTGRILVQGGRRITVEPDPGTDPTDTRAFLTGPVHAVLWHQRGLLPLHASVIAAAGSNARAVAIAGASGAGKSTLAAALAQKGHDVMADDICVIDLTAGGEPTVLPGIRRLRLLRDALDHFGISTHGLPRALAGKEKFLLDHGKPSANEPLRLAAVVVLIPQSSDIVAIERLRGAPAVAEIHAVVHMPQAARALGRDPEIFAAAARLITAGVTVWRLRFPNDLACLDEAAMKALAVIV